jgi:hypothetical protein
VRLAVALLCTTVACGSAEPGPERAEPSPRLEPTREAVMVLDKLAGGLRSDRAVRVAEVVDPEHGLVFWGQPGACAAPLFRVFVEDTGLLSQLASERIVGAPPHYKDPDGYWREVAEAIRGGLRVVNVDAGRYQVPPEKDLERAPSWASLDTRDVALGDRDHACTGRVPKSANRVPASEYRFRFRAERGYSSVTVYLVEHGGELKVAHVLLTWHYDA